MSGRILVTGANGFVGHALAERMTLERMPVRIAVRRRLPVLPIDAEQALVADLAQPNLGLPLLIAGFSMAVVLFNLLPAFSAGPGRLALLERDDLSSNRHPALSFCLSMISAQTLRVCREGKPVSTFPDFSVRFLPSDSCLLWQARLFWPIPDRERRAAQ